MENVLQIVRHDGKYHVFDIRDGQTVGALVARDFDTTDAAVDWCCRTYGVAREAFTKGAPNHD